MRVRSTSSSTNNGFVIYLVNITLKLPLGPLEFKQGCCTNLVFFDKFQRITNFIHLITKFFLNRSALFHFHLTLKLLKNYNIKNGSKVSNNGRVFRLASQ